MKLIRFMSVAELEKFRAGELLENTTQHQAKTDAVGFCFLDYDDYNEQYAYHFLSGVVSTDIVAVFETENTAALKEGSGTYADPHGSFFQSMQVTEYSTLRYHNKEGGLKLLKYCDDFAHRYKDDSFDRIFEWKDSGAPIKRRIPATDKSTPPRPPKPDTPEQRLLDAVAELATIRMGVILPPEYFDGFTLSAAPTMNVDHALDHVTLNIEGLQFSKHAGRFL